MYGYIYLTTNLINGKKYIGQHKASKFEPDKYIGSGVWFKKAVLKYGKENFKCELIQECSSFDELNKQEEYWIKYFNAVESELFYNIDAGSCVAPKTDLFKQHLKEAWTDERKQKLSERVSGDKNPSKRPEVREKISINNSSKRPEIRKRLSEAKTGKPNPHTAEWNANIGKALKGRQIVDFTDEVREKISKSKQGKNNPMYGKSVTKNTKWYNNGSINIRAMECPNGFTPGRLSKKKGLYPDE